VIPFKLPCIIISLALRREQLFIGMVCFRKQPLGLTACLLFNNVQLRLGHLSHISSELISTGLPGITRITLRSIQVSHKFLPPQRENPGSDIFTGGLLGPMIIHGPSNANYDIDLGPVFLTDYYHMDYYSVIEEVMGNGTNSNPRPASDNNLINGKMNFDCSTVAAGDKTPCTNNAGISKFKFTTGKTHRLRLINAGSEGIQRFSIDGHQMTVIANDFVPIVSFVFPHKLYQN
jgi:hypothetical protein